jgi:hypothetical protein
VRRYFEANLSEEQNFAQLMAIYSQVGRAGRSALRRHG